MVQFTGSVSGREFTWEDGEVTGDAELISDLIRESVAVEELGEPVGVIGGPESAFTVDHFSDPVIFRVLAYRVFPAVVWSGDVPDIPRGGPGVVH